MEAVVHRHTDVHMVIQFSNTREKIPEGTHQPLSGPEHCRFQTATARNG